MGWGVLIKAIYQSVVMAIIVIAYVKIIKFQDINIEFNNARISKNSALIAVFISIIMTIIYNKYFTNIFPINTILNFSIVRFALSIPAIICMIINKEKIISIGFTKENLFKSILLGFLIGFIYFLTYNTKSLYVLKNINIQSAKVMIYLFVYYFIVGFGEEFLYRGYLQTRLVFVNGEITGWLLTSIIFAFMHISQRIIIDKLGLLQAVLSCTYLIPISLVLGYISMKTKNLASSAICHTFIDWTSLIFMYVK